MTLRQASAHKLPLPDESVHCVVTSPPYWALRKYRDELAVTWEDGATCALGHEPTPEAFVAHLVQVFREVRRVLRSDGVLFVDVGDSYAGNGSGAFRPGRGRADGIVDERGKRNRNGNLTPPGLKPLDKIGVPHRLALALQADGWYWRADIIWAKPAPMPESVDGWRWEKHQVKVAVGGTPRRGDAEETGIRNNHHDDRGLAEWADCPGCPVCASNGGYVLRRGSWRPTTSHESVLMLTKTSSYYCDKLAVQEAAEYGRRDWNGQVHFKGGDITRGHNGTTTGADPSAGRNARDVQTWGPEPSKFAHYAAYPTALPSWCIRAATPDAGVCSACGAPWARVVKPTAEYAKLLAKANDRGDWYAREDTLERRDDGTKYGKLEGGIHADYQTLGWRPTCSHDVAPVPATVLDPFVGTGTTLVAAQRLGRRGIGCDVSPTYLEMARQRIEAEPVPLPLAEARE